MVRIIALALMASKATSVHGMGGIFSTDAPTTAPTVEKCPYIGATITLNSAAADYAVTADNTCVVVAGDLSGYTINVPAGLACARVMVKSGGIIGVTLPVA